MALSRSARLVGVAALALALAAPAHPALAEPDRHGSDGVRGPLLRDVAAARSTGPTSEPEPEQTWELGPGVTYREWTATGLRQGGVRMHLLRADMDVPGVSLDLVSGRTATTRAPFSQLLAATGATAGVNADFFDIDDTGAPLGVGVDRRLGLLHGPRSGWNNTVAISTDGTATVGQSTVTGEVTRRGRVVAQLAGLNDPTLGVDEIGAYTAAWGTSPGRRVADGAKRMRQVVVRGGRVVSSTARVPAGQRIDGTLLVGRGRGAALLRALKPGQRVRVALRGGRPGDRVVVGGSVPLLRAGALATRDNGELHPRTAFGWSSDTREVLLLVADGRSESSSGLTLLQVARQLRSLGAEDALNLDGGGSSTLVAPDADGVVGVRNAPSDGRERRVPNGLAVRWTPAG